MSTTEGDEATETVDRLLEMAHRGVDARTGQCKASSHAPQRMFREDEVNDDNFR